MANKILETLVEPAHIEVGSTFLLKVKIQFTPSYNLITEDGYDLVTETGDNLITEGDYYNGQESN